jgi:hypothetical protein
MSIWIPFLSPWLERRREEKIQRLKREAENERRRQHKEFLAEQKRKRKQAEKERKKEKQRAEEYERKARIERYSIYGGAIDVAMQARKERLKRERGWLESKGDWF